mmetsp:Transcript_30830/g.82582  ORF Transcript_30830/g.82582 Transcript_30830/m.82582 type:complete len:278 (-) Transcript_30830:235-1068(-)
MSSTWCASEYAIDPGRNTATANIAWMITGAAPSSATLSTFAAQFPSTKHPWMLRALAKTMGACRDPAIPRTDEATSPHAVTKTPRIAPSVHASGARRSTTRRPPPPSTLDGATRRTGTHGGYSTSTHAPPSSRRSHLKSPPPDGAETLTNHPSTARGEVKFHTRESPYRTAPGAGSSSPDVRTPACEMTAQAAGSAVSRTAVARKPVSTATPRAYTPHSARKARPETRMTHGNQGVPKATDAGRALKRIQTDPSAPCRISQEARSRPPPLGHVASRR